MKKTKKKPAARKPAKSSGGLTKTTKKGRIELGEEQLSGVSGGLQNKQDYKIKLTASDDWETRN
jgi:hypothetical protein